MFPQRDPGEGTAIGERGAAPIEVSKDWESGASEKTSM